MLPNTRRVELILKKKFIIAALNLDHKTFVIYVVTINISFNISDKEHPLRKTLIAHLKVDEASTRVLSKYTNFANIFSPKTFQIHKYQQSCHQVSR